MIKFSRFAIWCTRLRAVRSIPGRATVRSWRRTWLGWVWEVRSWDGRLLEAGNTWTELAANNLSNHWAAAFDFQIAVRKLVIPSKA